MGAIAAVAEGFAGFGVLDDACDFDFEFAFNHRETLDGTALVGIRVEDAAGIRVDIVPLQPFDRFDPADNAEADLAIIRGENWRVAFRGFVDERFVARDGQDAFDGNIKRL